MNAISPAMMASTSLSPADAALPRLGTMLEHFIAREEAVWAELGDDFEDDDPLRAEAADRGDDTALIAGEIIQHPATTLEGLLIKVRAFQGCASDFGPKGPDNFIYSRGEPSLCEMIMASVLSDLTHILAASRSSAA